MATGELYRDVILGAAQCSILACLIGSPVYQLCCGVVAQNDYVMTGIRVYPYLAHVV